MDSHRERVSALEDDARELVDELRPAYQDSTRYTDPLDYIELIRSPDAVAARFDDLQRSVETEMLIFAKPPVAVGINKNVAGLELAKRGVLRSIYELSFLRDDEQLAGVLAFLDAGEHARFVEQLPMKLGIIDERLVLFTLPAPIAGREDLTTMVVEHPYLARTLKLAFASIWAGGATFEQACDELGIRRRADS